MPSLTSTENSPAEFAAAHGVRLTGDILSYDEHTAMLDAIDYARPHTCLADPALTKITRLRLLSDVGFPAWELSYCWGELADGTAVNVNLPRDRFSKKALKADLIDMCKEAGRYGKGMGIFDALSTMQA